MKKQGIYFDKFLDRVSDDAQAYGHQNVKGDAWKNVRENLNQTSTPTLTATPTPTPTTASASVFSQTPASVSVSAQAPMQILVPSSSVTPQRPLIQEALPKQLLPQQPLPQQLLPQQPLQQLPLQQPPLPQQLLPQQPLQQQPLQQSPLQQSPLQQQASPLPLESTGSMPVVSPVEIPAITALPVEAAPVEALPVDFQSFEVKPIGEPSIHREFFIPTKPKPMEWFQAHKKSAEEHQESKIKREESRLEREQKKAQKPGRVKKEILKKTFQRASAMFQHILTIIRGRKRLFSVLLGAFLVVVLLIVLSQLFMLKTLTDKSMSSFLEQDETVLVSKSSYWFKEPQYGDIVMFKVSDLDSSGSEVVTTGRIIGLPGDKINIWDGNVYRNGELVNETYVQRGTTTGRMDETFLSEGNYFILGDNRAISRERSSSYTDVALIPQSHILGKVVLRLLPLDKFRSF